MREFEVCKDNNYDVSGSGIARPIQMTSERQDRGYCMRVKEMDENAGTVVVAGGTNDYGHGEAPLGLPGDRTPFTFLRRLPLLINELLLCHAGKHIVILTPLRRLNAENPMGSSKLKDIAPLAEYRRILMEGAEYYALPILDYTLYPTYRRGMILSDRCQLALIEDSMLTHEMKAVITICLEHRNSTIPGI